MNYLMVGLRTLEVVLVAIAILKLILWLTVFAVLWLTLRARRLRK